MPKVHHVKAAKDYPEIGVQKGEMYYHWTFKNQRGPGTKVKSKTRPRASQLTRSLNSKTMPVGLMDFTSQFTLNWGGMCALAVLMIIPALILTFLVQKHLIAGLTFGGVKG